MTWDHLQVHAHIDLRTANAAGIAVGVGGGTPVPQAVLATVEKDGKGYALVARKRDGSGETELGRVPVTISGPFLLEVIAYDDVVRASVGQVSVDGPRGAVREGRVALVADGPAAFAGIEVGALDIYSFDYVTSKYASFGEHLDSYDGELPTLPAGALGGTPTPIGTVVGAHAAEIPPVMQPSADPQERQKLFDAIVSALGIGLRKHPTGVTITRLTDGSGTFGLLIESPEPISLTRDVTLTLTHHVVVWVPGASVPPRPPVVARGGRILGPGPVEAAAAAALATLPPATAAQQITERRATAEAVRDTAQALRELSFGATKVTVPNARAVFTPGDQIARVVAVPSGTQIEIYDPPLPTTGPEAQGELRETLPSTQAQQQPAFSAIAKLGAGAIAVIGARGVVGPVQSGHWQDEEVLVPILALTNGAETAVVILSATGTAIGADKYTLHLVLDRDRWKASTAVDPEQHYHDERAIPLQW